MNKTDKKTVKEYLKKVSGAPDCSRSLKKALASELKSQIAERFENEAITYEKLCAVFGTPEQIAAGFYSRQDYTKLLKKAKKLNKVLLVLSVVLVIVIVFFTLLVINLYNKVGGTITVGGAGSGTYTIN